ncbi:unnamed protein product [Cuscuta campestris]|uniref:MalT-like TPR region domain-containing protein n=1 Tax=Cuscuta campestris TaxID=132261 RepID=A0A484K7E9_9ASTE|nr:unnamed protein product [Cuscuta campestris]
MRRASSSTLILIHRRAKLSSLISSSAAAAAHEFRPHITQTPPFLSRDANTPHKPQMFNTLAEQTPPQISSRQRKIKQKSDLEEAFESAESTEEMLKALKDMETCFDERELGMACLKMGLKLDQEGHDPEKTLSFAARALNSFDRDEDDASLPLAMTLQVMGSASYGLKRFNDSLGYLNRAKRVLRKLEESASCNVENSSPILHAVELELYNVKTAMGRREEALTNLLKALELKELVLDERSGELGKAYREVAEAYVSVLNFREAYSYCMRALNIHKALLGNNSVQVAHDRRLLGIIHSGLQDHDAALEENELSQKVLKNWGLGQALLQAEIDTANFQIALGRYYDAIDTLKSVLQRTDKESKDRAMVLLSMSKALSSQENFQESKKCLDSACEILGKKEKSFPVEVSEAYMEISTQYELMNEFETAISLLNKALRMLEKIPQEQHSVGTVSARIGWLLLLTGKKEKSFPVEVSEAYMEISTQYELMNEFETAISLLNKALRMLEKIPQEQHSVGTVSARIGWLLLLTGKVEQAIPSLEDAAERLKESFGSKHFSIGYVYNNLGAAYLELDRPQSAAQVFAYAKDVMDVSLGPHHADSIEAVQNLSKAYAAMGSYELAVDFQKKAVEAWEGHGQNAEDELKEARQILDQLMTKARASLLNQSPAKALPSANTRDRRPDVFNHRKETKEAYHCKGMPSLYNVMNSS